MSYLKEVLIRKIEEGFLYNWILDKFPPISIIEQELINAL